MSERRRRRTQSAAEVEFAGCQHQEPSPLTQRSRRKSSARQARLLPFPCTQTYFNGMSLQNQNMAMSQPIFPGMGYQQQMVYPQPQMCNNSIIFTLLPQQREIPYTINIDKMHFPRAILKASSGVMNLTFSINNKLFSSAVPPVDISNLTNHGINYFQFCTFGYQSPIFVEVALESMQNPEVLAQQIVSRFPEPPQVMSDPFSIWICPLSNQKMELPGRGVDFSHYQCFDLKSFIKRGIESNCWECPICRNTLSYEELRYDRNYMKEDTIFTIPECDDSGNLFSDCESRRFDPFD